MEVGQDKETDKEKGEEAALEKEKEKEEELCPEGGNKGGKEEKTIQEEAKVPKALRRPKTMQIKVTLLDDALYDCELDVRTHTHSDM